MAFRRTLLLLVAPLGVAVSSLRAAPAQTAQAKPAKLQMVLNQMDAASAKFTSAQADVRQELFTKMVQDTEIQTGEIYFLRKANSLQMGMKLLPPDAAPDAQPSQVLELKDGKARMFNPGVNQIDESSATGKNKTLAEAFMTLGFGGSGTDLAKAWTITDQGKVIMKDGGKTVDTEQLDLVSTDPSIRSTFSHITIWLDPVRDVTLRQVFFEASGGKPSGDTRTVYFANIRSNQTVDTSPFAIKCKGKCTVVQR